MTNLPQSRQSDIVVQEFENEVLIYDLKSNKAFCLNETSAMIWQMCDGTKNVAEISQSLSNKLSLPFTEDVIWLALNGFKNDNLLEQSEQLEINFNGLSRRQVIKKVGLASMIALPVIASVVAPSAAMAQSGCVNPGGASPGTIVNPCNFAAACSNVLPPSCCSGKTTFTVTNCSAPNPGSGVCSCAA